MIVNSSNRHVFWVFKLSNLSGMQAKLSYQLHELYRFSFLYPSWDFSLESLYCNRKQRMTKFSLQEKTITWSFSLSLIFTSFDWGNCDFSSHQILDPIIKCCRDRPNSCSIMKKTVNMKLMTLGRKILQVFVIRLKSVIRCSCLYFRNVAFHGRHEQHEQLKLTNS